ncbi:hypothetical protein [Nocardiopsis alkaliphila]|uniref:hypothetical protein n=1 Tax=Nocardiopsis alkaliphila TaxID=225762 RepID=UPI00034841C3|nr:hypothetical protein [Nocardiopsis alkaliphila]
MPDELVRTVSALRTALIAITLGVAAVGCSTSDSPAPDAELREDAESPVPGADEAMDELFDLPIHAYMFTAVEQATLRNAHEILVEECMRDLGFSFTRGEPQEVDPLSVAAFGPQSNYLGRWHVDAEYAAENGFSHPEELLRQHEEEMFDGRYEEGAGGELRDLRIDHQGQTYDAAVAALQGFPEGAETPSGDPVPEWGCEGWAETELDEGVRIIGVEEAQAGEVPTPLGESPVATQISNDSQEEAAADQEVLDAEAAWRDCMADSGYPGEDPDTVGSGRDTRVDSDDTEAAVRNVECREEAGLTETYLEVLSRIQERDIAANETALRERAEEMEAVLERAVDLTSR